MDALLIALFLGAMTTAGGKFPLLMRSLRERFSQTNAIDAGALCASATNAAFSAWVGSLLVGLLTPEARSLLLSLAIAVGGLFLLFKPSPPKRLCRMPGGPFQVAVLGFLLVCLGESAQFIIASVAAARADPLMAGLGGWIGCVAGIFAFEQAANLSPAVRRTLRAGAAVVLMLAGFFLAMGTLSLV